MAENFYVEKYLNYFHVNNIKKEKFREKTPRKFWLSFLEDETRYLIFFFLNKQTSFGNVEKNCPLVFVLDLCFY